MKLFAYWRSSASWRVRIGLHLKQIPYTYVPVNLVKGEHKAGPHVERNGLAQVPVLQLEDGRILTQSLAILTYLESLAPSPRLFPEDPWAHAQALSLAEMVNAGIQPMQNLSLLQAISGFGGDRQDWGRTMISRGLLALEKAATPGAGTFLCGDSLTIADICLVPQLYNARRFDCDLSKMPLLTAVEARCAELPAFQAAHPSVQPDAVS